MDPLRALVAAELAVPVAAEVAAMAAAIAARHPGARAVLFYGSCLREARLDGLMLDFYLLVDDYRAAFDRRWLALANRLIPPNVFPFAHDGLVAKYAVLTLADFARLNRPGASTVSVWARFAQPSRLAWASDGGARDAAIDAIVEAPVTLFRLTLPTLDPDAGNDLLEVWRRGFARTYGAELRAERMSRPGSIVDVDPERYARFGQATLAVTAARHGIGAEGEVPNARSAARAARRWRQLARRGKALTLVRLAKATATYAGGIDYLAWKIGRHSGTPIALRPWQRRWPVLGALALLPRLLARGAVR